MQGMIILGAQDTKIQHGFPLCLHLTGNVPAGFYQIIKQWTRDKGLQFSTESERGTFAYFVARKIAREGTQRHRLPVDVYSTPAKAARNEIESVLRNMVKVGIETSLKTAETHF